MATVYHQKMLMYRLNFDNINICLLPRESRLVFVVYGRSSNSDQTSNTENTFIQTELGWASIQFFNYDK